MTKRGLFLLSLAVATTGPKAAHATCGYGPQNRRVFVAQPPDIVFVAGTPSTQYIPEVFLNYDSTGEPRPFGDDCGASAGSTIPGVSVQETYCDWSIPGSCHITPARQYAGVDHSLPFLHPAIYRNNDTNHVRPVPVIYDGTAPAGTVGTVTFVLLDDVGQVVYSIGRVNVYVVASAAMTWFTATSSAGSIAGDSFAIDSPLLNGNAGAALFITNAYNGTYWPHPTAVTYDSGPAKWRIRNEDGAAMPVGLSFNVRVDPSATRVAPCSAPCPDHNYLVIDDPVSNGNPYATILVTPESWGSGRFAHPFAVSYVSPHWEIISTDGQNIGTNRTRKSDPSYGGRGFFVKVIGASQYVDDDLTGDASGFRNTNLSNGVGIDINGPLRTRENAKVLSAFCWTTKGLAPLIVTQNQTPLPPPAPHNYNNIDPDYFGVSVLGNIMTVYHEVASKVMPATSAFNVWGPYRADCSPQ